MVSAVQLDPAFSCVKKDLTGFFIWRIENLQVVSVQKENFGKFHKGDSYIIYSAAERGKVAAVDEKPHTPRGYLEVHVHFWVGSETSQDEAGVAAIKTVELDQGLGGSPVQHREMEANESKRFLSYFKNGIRYLNGGVASGLHHVKDEFQVSLYHVKGKRFIVVHQLPQVSWSNINEGDVFVLDCKAYIYVWTGGYSNHMEKLLGARFATKLKDEHGVNSCVVILEDGQEAAMTEDERLHFEAHLPLNQKQVVPFDQAPKDEIVLRRLTSEIKLFKCSDEKGTLKVTEVKNGPFSQRDLDSNDSFIIDNGHQGVWVWVGKRATTREREEAMRNAQGFITKKGYPAKTQVSRIVDGGEPPEFKTLFGDWRDKDESDLSIGFRNRLNRKQVKPTVQTKFDATTLHQRPELSARTQMVDDGSGQKEIWRVKQFDLQEVEEDSHGEFFSGDCYIILYAYTSTVGENYIIYYWIGSEASLDEGGTAALKVVELDDKLQGRAVQVRVTQGKEPPHFMAIFAGKLVIYEGGFASSFDGKKGEDRGRKSSYMLQVTGNSALTTKAVEVDLRAGCLNSNDCFIVVSRKTGESVVWCGKGSTGDEREMAKKLARSQGDPVLVSEGHEKESFWKLIGGREEYASSKLLKETSPSNPARLFQCSNAVGVFRAEEIFDFEQADLADDDVMLLDAWETVFLWLGRNSNKQEQREAEHLSFEYLKTDPAGRSAGTTVVTVKQGFEPPNFTGFFGAWNNNLWNANETYADISKRLEKASPGATVLVTPSGVTNGSGPRKTFPLSTLRAPTVDKLPPGVDPTCKEEYLCESDFVRVLGLAREAFYDLPQWKRLNLKKKAGIF